MAPAANTELYLNTLMEDLLKEKSLVEKHQYKRSNTVIFYKKLFSVKIPITFLLGYKYT